MVSALARNLPTAGDGMIGEPPMPANSRERSVSVVVVVPSLLTATTDTRHYIEVADNLYRFHGFMVAASQAKSIHGTDEYIDVASYEKTIEVARQMMTLGASDTP